MPARDVGAVGSGQPAQRADAGEGVLRFALESSVTDDSQVQWETWQRVQGDRKSDEPGEADQESEVTPTTAESPSAFDGGDFSLPGWYELKSTPATTEQAENPEAVTPPMTPDANPAEPTEAPDPADSVPPSTSNEQVPAAEPEQSEADGAAQDEGAETNERPQRKRGSGQRNDDKTNDAFVGERQLDDLLVEMLPASLAVALHRSQQCSDGQIVKLRGRQGDADGGTALLDRGRGELF